MNAFFILYNEIYEYNFLSDIIYLYLNEISSVGDVINVFVYIYLPRIFYKYV